MPAITLNVRRIPNRGRFAEYPSLRNVDTGRVYVDTTLGQPRFLSHDADGCNRCGEFVGYNLPGAWTTWNGEEPDTPLRKDIAFQLQD